MAMKANEIPKKKKINRKVLDAAVDGYVEHGSFTITVPDDGDKNIEIQFKSFLSPVDRGVFLRQAAGTALLQDENTNAMVIDECALELAVHSFIFQILSTMPPILKNDDSGDLDVHMIGIYGGYFMAISDQYNHIFQVMYADAYDYCATRLQHYNRIYETVTQAFDMNQLMAQPEILEVVKDAVLSKNASQEEAE